MYVVGAVGDTDKSAVGDVTGGLGLGGKSDETPETQPDRGSQGPGGRGQDREPGGH